MEFRRVLLMSSGGPGLMKASHLSHRSLTLLVLFLLGLFALTNRPLLVRQLIGLNSNTCFHLPVGNSTSSHADRTLFFMESVDDASPDLQYIQRDGGIKTNSQTPIEEHWIGMAAETDALFRSPAQRFESVLNL